MRRAFELPDLISAAGFAVDHLPDAIGADPVGEGCAGVNRDVSLDFLPLAGVGANFFAVGADREHLLEAVHLRGKIQDAFCDVKAAPDGEAVDRFHQEIVHVGDDGAVAIFLIAVDAGDEDEIDVLRIGPGADFAAEGGAINAWHVPIADDDAGGVGIEGGPCVVAIGV